MHVVAASGAHCPRAMIGADDQAKTLLNASRQERVNCEIDLKKGDVREAR